MAQPWYTKSKNWKVRCTMENKILTEAKDLTQEIITHRRWLHSHAETGFDLERTKAYVRTVLEGMGYRPTDCGKSGLAATIGKKDGKCFLLRADMDALPIREETGLEFACKDGAMHACGHDLHTAMLLGAAQILKNHESELEGTVKLMFQPSEETFEGSKDMIEAGVLENPHVDAGMMIHVSAGVPIPAGTVLISAPGVSAPAADYFTIRVQGKGCHGSAPQDGVDPLTAAAHILIALQEIKARELGIADSAILTIGTMQAGTASNVIPNSVTMGGTIRTLDEDTRAFLKKRLTEISQGVAGAFRATAEVTFDSGCPTLVNDERLCEDAEKNLTELLGADRALSVAKLNPGGKPSAGGSEDFAYISHQIPTVMVALAAGEPKNGHTYPLHHPKVTFDESALPYGAATLSGMAMRYLQN